MMWGWASKVEFAYCRALETGMFRFLMVSQSIIVQLFYDKNYDFFNLISNQSSNDAVLAFSSCSLGLAPNFS